MTYSNPYGGSPLPQIGPPPREPRRYRRFAALVLSLFHRELYQDVAQRWRGIGLLYLLLLLALTNAPMAIEGQVSVRNFAGNDAPRVLEGFPAITINKGVVSIDRPVPYIWKDLKTGKPLLYVDTTGAFDLPEGANAPVKLSKSQLIFKDKTQTRIQDLSQIQSFSVDKTWLLWCVELASTWSGTFLFVGVMIVSFVWHLLQILLWGAIGLALCAMFEVKLDYPALVRIAAVALTPAILLDTVLDLTGTVVPFSWPLYFAMEIGYLAFGVYANRPPRTNIPGFPMTMLAAYPPPPIPPAPGTVFPPSPPR